jgi:hypothetical protein
MVLASGHIGLRRPTTSAYPPWRTRTGASIRAGGDKGKVFRIVETIVTQAEAMRAVETALALPTAVVVGKNVLALLEGRGWIANRIISRLSKWLP